MCSRSAQSEEQQADMVDNKVDNMVDIKEKETKKKVFSVSNVLSTRSI